MTELTFTPGHFVWRELISTDLPAAKSFYSALFGWTFQTVKMPSGMDYTMAQAGEKMVCGLMPPPMPGMPSYWMSYISVPDVAAAAAAADAHGGKVVAPPMDIGPGELAVFADPAGAHVSVWRAKNGDEPVEVPGLGTFCWETLTTTDAASATAFYKAVVGWTVTAGPAGPDSIVFNAGEHSVADVQVGNHAPPHWLTYVVVDGCDSAREKATTLGAKVVVPRIEVPNVGNIAVVTDPAGAYIGLFEPQFAR